MFRQVHYLRQMVRRSNDVDPAGERRAMWPDTTFFLIRSDDDHATYTTFHDYFLSPEKPKLCLCLEPWPGRQEPKRGHAFKLFVMRYI